MPVNSIWEGSGNIMCLDVLRALSKSPEALPVLLAELETARGLNACYDAALSRLAARLQSDAMQESSARTLACDLVLAMQAALLLRSSRSGVAEAFCENRLKGDASEVFGAQRAPLRAAEILDAAFA
jgi:putative acyl-CoA dehydrogenase